MMLYIQLLLGIPVIEVMLLDVPCCYVEMQRKSRFMGL